MRRHTVAVLILASMAAVAAESQAQTIYDDGGTHTINGPSGPIIVENGTTVNVVSPASITGTGENPGISEQYGSTVNITGGSVQSEFEAMSLLGNVQISGGNFLGLASPNPTGGTYFGVGAIIRDIGPLPWLISGGKFEGQGGDDGPGVGIVLSGNGSITGGTFIGDPPTNGGISYSLFYQAIYTPGQNTLNISGGEFSGSMLFDLLDPSSSVNFIGEGFQYQPDGVFSGTLADGHSIDVGIGAANTTTSITTIGSQEVFTFSVIASVPEPASLLMLTLGLGVVSLACAIGRKRKRPGPRAHAAL